MKVNANKLHLTTEVDPSFTREKQRKIGVEAANFFCAEMRSLCKVAGKCSVGMTTTAPGNGLINFEMGCESEGLVDTAGPLGESCAIANMNDLQKAQNIEDHLDLAVISPFREQK